MVMQVKGQSTYAPVGRGVPEAHPCPEDKGRNHQSQVFQDCSPHKTRHTYPLSRGSRGARVTLGSSRTFLPRLSLWQREAYTKRT